MLGLHVGIEGESQTLVKCWTLVECWMMMRVRYLEMLDTCGMRIRYLEMLCHLKFMLKDIACSILLRYKDT